MPIEAKCPNAECGAVLTLQDALAGKKVRCPKCGTVIAVRKAAAPQSAEAPQPAGEEMALEGEKAGAPKGSKKPQGWHPASFPCPNCKQLLPPATKFCPKCGADTVTGEIPKEAKKRKIPLPVLIAVGLVCAAVGAYVGFKVVSGLMGGKDGAAPAPAPGQQAGAPPVAPKPPKEEGGGKLVTTESVKAPEEKPKPVEGPAPPPAYSSAELERGRKDLKESVEAYLKRVADIAAVRNTKNPEEMAALWAKLHQFCKEKGFQREADMCWATAASWNPQSDETNAVLGRTARYMGATVTPEEKQFLDSLGSRVRVVNRNPNLDAIRVGLKEDQLADLKPGETWDVPVEAGAAEVVLSRAGATGTETVKVPVQVAQGRVYTVALMADHLVPIIDSPELVRLPGVVRAWDQTMKVANPPTADELGRRGWRKTGEGWDVQDQGRLIRFFTADGKNLTAVSVGETKLSKLGEDGPEVSMVAMTVTIKGKLEMRIAQTKTLVLEGPKDRPIVLNAQSPQTAAAWLSEAVWIEGSERRDIVLAQFGVKKALPFTYEVTSRPNEAIGRALGGLSERMALYSEYDRLSRRYEELAAELKDKEARGELVGGWHSAGWMEKEFGQARMAEWERGRKEADARKLPFYVDHAAALGIKERASFVHLNWPHFRLALAKASEDAIAEVQDPLGRFQLLPVLPDAQAERMLAGGMPNIQKADFDEAMERLTFMRTPLAVRVLGQLASNGPNVETRVRAYLALGEMATNESLGPCRTPTIERAISAASLAALAGAADQGTLSSLSATLDKALPEVRQAYLGYLLQMDCPTMMPAVVHACTYFTDAQLRTAMAKRLGEMKGHVAAYALGKLIDAQKDTFWTVTPNFEGEETGLLVESLAGVMRSQSKESSRASVLLGKGRSRFAVPYLKAAAIDDKQVGGVVGLAIYGSKETLWAATQARDMLRDTHMAAIAADWRDRNAPAGKWQLDPRVDAKAAAEFLQTVLREGQDLGARATAGWLLCAIGEVPNRDALLALAVAPVPKVPAAGAGGAPGGPPMPGQPGQPMQPGAPGMPPGMVPGMGPGMPGMGQPGGAAPQPGMEFQLEQPSEQQPSDKAPVIRPQVQAVQVLSQGKYDGLSAGLQKVIETSELADVKIASLRLLGRVADDKGMDFLWRYGSGTLDEPKTVADAFNIVRYRVAAVVGMASGGHPDAASAISGLCTLSLPQLPSGKKQAAPAGGGPPMPGQPMQPVQQEMQPDSGGAVTLDRLAAVKNMGVFEAICALPPDKLLWQSARDKGQADRVINWLCDQVEQGLLALGTKDSRTRETAEAIRCLGRTGNVPGRAWNLFDQLAGDKGASAPMEVQTALMNALVRIGGQHADQLLGSMFTRRSEARPPYGYWYDLCIRLAMRGNDEDYKLLTQCSASLNEDHLRKVVEVMQTAKGEQPRSYCEVLELAAARPVQGEAPRYDQIYAARQAGEVRTIEGAMPGGMPPGGAMPPGGMGAPPAMPGMPGGPMPGPEGMPGPAMPFAPGVMPGPGGMPDMPPPPGAMQPQPGYSEQQPGQPAAAPTVVWSEQVAFRLLCLELLAKGPKGPVSDVLRSDTKLLETQGLGPLIAAMIAERAPTWDAVGYLKGRFDKAQSADEQEAAVAAVRKVGNEAARQLLETILLSQPLPDEPAGGAAPGGGARPGAGGAVAPAPAVAPGGVATGPRLALEARTWRAIGRALGSLGDYKTLRKAIGYKQVGQKIQFLYALDARLAALEGMAYLPEADDPADKLKKAGLIADPDHKMCIENALLRFYHLHPKAAPGGAGGGG